MFILSSDITKRIINKRINKEAFKATKEILVEHSFNKVYNSNVLDKKKPKVVQRLFANSYIFDLSCKTTFKLKKNLVRAAFQDNFCREFNFLSNRVFDGGFVNNGTVQTVQLALHCSKSPMKFTENGFLQRKKFTALTVNKFTRYLNLKTKVNTYLRIFRNTWNIDLLTLGFKLNKLSISYEKEKDLKPKKTILVLEKSLKKKLTICLIQPLVFIKVISKVLNKTVKKESTSSFWFQYERNAFNFKNKRQRTPTATSKKLAITQKTKVKNLAHSKGSSQLAEQKRRFRQTWAGYPGNSKSGTLFGGPLMRADWIFCRFIELFNKKKKKILVPP